MKDDPSQTFDDDVATNHPCHIVTSLTGAAELDLAVISDGAQSQAAVEELLGRLFPVMERIPLWDTVWWHTADLEHVSRARQVRQSLSQAHLIIVSCATPAEPLPWWNTLQEWLRVKTGDEWALVLLNPFAESPCPAGAVAPGFAEAICRNNGTLFIKKVGGPARCACQVAPAPSCHTPTRHFPV